MPERDGYIPGVPCWVDTNQPDPEAAVAFYSGLFGWECENVMPAGSDVPYFVARLRGLDVAGVGALPPDGPTEAGWNTYISVESADETAAKVAEAGGQALMEPADVMDQGRAAVFSDPEGAVFCVWQPKRHKGAQIVNEPGSVNFNGLHTRDVESAKAFYGAVFGWRTLALGGDVEMWTLPGYGDHLELANPGNRARVAALGGLGGFEDVVASINPIPDDQMGVAPHWSVTFSVDDADAVADKAFELGGKVLVAPVDAPWSRMTIIADPQGASFIATKFVPENRDVAPASVSASAA
jgi:predicted enzyme related to lactoylglutathione lyase